MSSPNLPAPIEAYFAAEHAPQVLHRCFKPQAVLKDEGRTHSGVDAIVSFLAQASARYRATSLPMALRNEGDLHVVRAQVIGEFPGSPIELSYRFRIDDGLIASLEITP